MFRYLKHFFIVSTCVLTSCSSIYGNHGIFQNRGADYLNANQIPPLRIPPGVSSSTIQAHYPVSDREYPDSHKPVKLVPPDLSSAKPINKAPANLEMPVVNPVIQNPAASTNQPQTNPPALQHQAQNRYYDAHTRSTTGGAGKPIASVLNKVWPFGKKSSASPRAETSTVNNSSLFGKTSTGTAVSASATQTPPATTTNASPNGKSFSSFVKSLWPWGKQSASSTKPDASSPDSSSQKTVATTASSTSSMTASAPQSTTNDSGNSPSQTGKMPSMYFDRYTRR